MIDLHSHSTASDGTLSPIELIDLAVKKGLTALALTDHDTTAGLEEAAQRAAAHNLRFIPGIEIEIKWDLPGVFHLLGLNIVNYKESLQETLIEIQGLRNWRNEKIIEKMQADNIKVSLDDILPFSGGTIVTRPHFADYMVNSRLVKNKKEAFDKYLAQGKPYYQSYPGLDLKQGLDAIHKAGGKAILAHPLSLYLSWPRLEEFLYQWKDLGLDGVEAYHSGARVIEAQKIKNLAEKLNLLVSAGSDFHGSSRPDRKLGKTLSSGISIDDHFLSIFDEL